MKAETATDIGQQALIWLADRPDLLGRFLAASGAGPGDLRARAADPEFLGFLLDFLLGSDETTRAFAEAAGLRPEDPARARAALPGGSHPEWT